MILGATVIYAYFSNSHGEDKRFGIDPEIERIEVSDFKELFFVTQARNYNDISGAADITKKSRKTVTMTKDITFDADLEITADVHLDLGGFNLYLNGHTLTFRHSYHGSIVLSNGNVILSKDKDGKISGAVYADTPNAAVMLSGVQIGTIEGSDFTAASDRFSIISAKGEFVAYNLFKMVAAAVADESNTLKERSDYSTIENSNHQFTSADFIYRYKTDDCTNHNDIPCSYIFSDIDLPMYYMGYPDAVVSYSAENNIVTSFGGITGTGSDRITATVSINGTTYSCDFYIHVPDISNADNQKTVILEMVKRYLSRYWIERTSDGIDESIIKKYVINHDTYLPTQFSFSSLTVEYVGFDANGGTTVTHDSNSVPFAIFKPTLSTVRLVANVSGTSESKVFDITSSNVATVKNAVTVANDLMKKWYGTEITVTVDKNGVYSYSNAIEDSFPEYLPLYGIGYYKGSNYETAYPGINSIEYSIVYGDTIDEYYTIENETGKVYQQFKVVSGKHPENDAGSVYLNVKMNVTYNGKASDVVIQIPVKCYISGDDGLSRFMPYYSVFNKRILEQTGGYTLKSFNMPFNYRNGLPLVCYAISAKEGSTADSLDSLGNAIKIFFVDINGTAHELTGKKETVEIISGGTSVQREIISFTDSLEALLTDSEKLRSQAESGTAYYTVKIDTTALDPENLGLALTYQYKLSYDSPNWSTFNLTTDITIPGILRNGIDVTDINFYKWIFDKFNPNGKVYDSGGLILTDWLASNIEINYKNDTELQSVNNFTGLKYLIGTQKLSLSGANGKIKNSNIQEIAYMKSLTNIDLSECGISIDASTESPFLSWVSDTSQLTNLVSIDLRSNTIYDFNWLESMSGKSAMLMRIIISDNLPGTNNANNVFYGSDGLSNYGTYRELVSQGILIYSGGTADSPIQFADSRSSSRLYLNLCSIEYQNKIPSDVDILAVLNELSTNAADFGISNEASNASYSCTVSNVTISYEAVNNNTFALVYSAYANNQAYKIIIKFSVTRGR